MAVVKFTIFVDNVNNTITFKDNLTNWSTVDGIPSTLTIYMKGEDKDDYIVKKEITSAAAIALFQDTGLVLTYADLFGLTTPIDNFYLVEIIANEGLDDQMLSDKMAVGFTINIAERIYYGTIGVHVPVTDLFESLTLGMMPQALELLKWLSIEAVYTYDREVKWRKIYNHLYTVVNDLDY